MRLTPSGEYDEKSRQLLKPIHTESTAIYVYVCLSVCLSVFCLLIRTKISGTTRPNFTKFLCTLPMIASRYSPSGSFAIRYVFPVLWMTSRFPITGPTAA